MLTNKGRNICRIRGDTSLSRAGRKQAHDTATLLRATLRYNRNASAWKPKNVLAGSRRCFQIKCDDAIVVGTPHDAPATCSETGAPWTTLRWRISNLSCVLVNYYESRCSSSV